MSLERDRPLKSRVLLRLVSMRIPILIVVVQKAFPDLHAAVAETVRLVPKSSFFQELTSTKANAARGYA
jgi:hypothetical protein